ncbi:phage holin [Thermoactinomyces sp. DSM 45892]|uniref:phage holin n=1 Tax=Thermoactinomyces sp. DSM 45892 TaxID=1882753 RepID=UPI000894B933|nr:phage holin [Thermoactinomyces sp. DSM 45892]SDZ01194.1 holin, phage phi LC3 family [Thermoactinomyces sp. DSM 45892]
MKNNRWKNGGMWISLTGLVFLFLQNIGVDVSPVKQGAITTLIDSIVGLLVVLGILNNPTTGNKGFLDDAKGSDNKEVTNNE